ncbi:MULTISPECIES: hypothetical protein [Dermabacter]|uniref:Integrase n=1 Tax=Dermabacter vaginalis TaxID=1630135 RepID=A0ABX6A290_9MICO|nr:MULTISPECIES: hypothetical protein [Dermabacter]QEU11282.1 hypothetical protein FOB48_02510 [Dermabacter vaginalis]RUP86723.1 hypothetical protein D8M36_04965 [Dermabacter sp. HSID17554]
MTLSAAMRHVRDIATSEGLRFSKRQLRTCAVHYLNWWKQLEAKTTAHLDPTVELAVRRVLAQAA